MKGCTYIECWDVVGVALLVCQRGLEDRLDDDGQGVVLACLERRLDRERPLPVTAKGQGGLSETVEASYKHLHALQQVLPA
jgi:hypothetical protein